MKAKIHEKSLKVVVHEAYEDQDSWEITRRCRSWGLWRPRFM